MIVNHFNQVSRLYDAVRDNPVELTVGKAKNALVFVMVDRDEGNTELSITVEYDDILAAIALTRSTTVCEDCYTQPGVEGETP